MRRVIDTFALIFLTVVIFVVSIFLCSILVENVLLPSDYLFYENTPLCSSLLAPLLIIPSLVAAYYIVYFLKKKITSTKDDFYHIVWFGKKLGKWNVAIIAVWIIAFYVSFTSLTYVTNDKIVVVSPLNLKGKDYGYFDVEEIETGFGDKKFSLVEYKIDGNFYYIVTVDGQKTVFHMPSVNPDITRYEDTYLELEEFDQALRKYDISKESSSEGYDKCNFDQRYVDRFLRIIESK